MSALLELDDVTTYYAQMRILEGISLRVDQGELVCLLGGNASGKSTTLKTILGLVRPRSGRVLLDGDDVTDWPVPRRIARGIAIVPENRRLFGQLSVRENLELGAVLRRGESLTEDFDRVHALFPRLLERRNQLAGTLSGGEQQMVAMGRALMSRPRLLLMDEPSMGLSPALVEQNFQIIAGIHDSGVAVLVVEQNATMALSIADRGYVLSTGSLVLAGPAADLLRHDELKRAYLGRLAEAKLASVARRIELPASSFTEFGTLLRVLRRAARLTQRDLGIAVGYSEAQISRLEQGKRLPDPAVVAALFVPSLRLSNDPELASRLHVLAQAARDSRDWPEPAPSEDQRDGTATHPDELIAIPAAPRLHVARPAAGAQLRDRLTEVRHVLVCGPPGVGKTTLVAAVGRELAADVPVCWLTFTQGITTPMEAVIRRLARFLDRHGEPEAAPLLDRGQAQRPLPHDEQLYLLATALGRIGALICLDNAHLLGGEERTRAVVEHLADSSRAALVAVSREDFQLAGFEPFRVGGLDRREARTLIERLAGDVLPARVAGRLIDRTDGSPMLIRLALGPVGRDEPDPAALVERLEAQSAVSAYLLQATLGGLSEPGRLLVALLAVFRHPVDLLDERLIEASRAIEGDYDVIAGIEELRRRQLVDHAARATLHPLVRDHVYAGLAGEVARRSSLHWLAAAHCELALGDPLEASWHYARAGDPAEAADLLVASVVQLTASGRSARAAELAAELLGDVRMPDETVRQLQVVRGDLLMNTEQAGVAEEAYRDALARPAPPAVRAGVAWRLAQCLLQRGQVLEALGLCRGAAAGLTDDDAVLHAHLATVQSQAHLMLSEFDQAVTLATRACALADQIAAVTADIAAGIGCRAFGVLGVVARLRGQQDEAGRLLRRSLTAAREAGFKDMTGRALFNLAAIAHERGELDHAERLYGEALAEMRQIGDGFGTARVLHSLGKIHHHRCAADDAMALFLESVALRRRLGDAQGAANSEHSYAHVLLSLGRTAEARELLAAALSATAELGERRSRGHYLDSLGMFALVDGDLAVADGYLAQAGEVAAEIGEPSLAAAVRLHRALAQLARGDTAGARRAAGRPESGTGDGGTLVDLEHLAITACIALSDADYAAAAADAAEMGRRAVASGFMLEAKSADRIAATVAAARSGTAPPAALYARLIWVSDETRDLESRMRDGSLTSTLQPRDDGGYQVVGALLVDGLDAVHLYRRRYSALGHEHRVGGPAAGVGLGKALVAYALDRGQLSEVGVRLAFCNGLRGLVHRAAGDIEYVARAAVLAVDAGVVDAAEAVL